MRHMRAAPIPNPAITPSGPASAIHVVGWTNAPQPIDDPRAIAHTQCAFIYLFNVVLFFDCLFNRLFFDIFILQYYTLFMYLSKFFDYLFEIYLRNRFKECNHKFPTFIF